MTTTPHTTSTALIRGAKPTFAPTNETEAAAKRNADNVRILAELPIPVWQRISEFTGMEDIYAMRASTSVFSRPISANHLEDLWQYTFKGRLIVPGCEIPFPTRSLDFPKGAAQTADMPALIGMAEQLSAELVDIQLKASELFSNIPANDLLQQDDIPWLFNYLFSEETQVEQTTLIARIMRLGNFFKTLLEAIEKKKLDGPIKESLYLLAKKTIYTIGCIGPLQYADFKAMTRRIGDLHAVLAHLEPTSNANDSLKAMLYRFIEHVDFAERFSISQLLSFISNVAEQTPTHIAQEVLAGIPCVERQLHPRHFPRWDLWLRMLPDVVSDSNLQSLLIDSQIPVNQQIAALAQKMFKNLINPLHHWSSQSNAMQYKNWNHECTNGCCQNAAQVYVNLVRLALLSVNDYRLKNMQTLCAIGLDEEMIELVQYQHKKQPFSTRDIASLLTSAPARALPALQAILLPSCSLVERMSIHALLTVNPLLRNKEQWVQSLAPFIGIAIPMCIIGFVSWTIVRTLAELTPLKAMSTEATNALQVGHGIATNSSRKLWEYVQQAIEVNLPALQKALTERNFTQLFRK